MAHLNLPERIRNRVAFVWGVGAILLRHDEIRGSVNTFPPVSNYPKIGTAEVNFHEERLISECYLNINYRAKLCGSKECAVGKSMPGGL